MPFRKTHNGFKLFILLLTVLIIFILFLPQKSMFGYNHGVKLTVHRLMDSARVYQSNKKLALPFIDSVFSLLNSDKDFHLMANAYLIKGDVFKANNDLDKADSAYHKSYSLYQDLEKDENYLHLLKSLAIVNYYLNHNKDMLYYALEGIWKAKYLNNKSYEGTFNNLSGIAIESLGDEKRSLTYYFKALKIFESLQDKTKIASVETNIGNVYEAEKQFVEAEKHYKKTLRLAIQIKDTDLISAAYNNLGIVYFDLKDYKKAKYLLLQGLYSAKKSGDNYAVANSLTNLGMLYSNLKMNDSTLYYQNRALQLAKKVDNSRTEYYVYRYLAEHYGSRNQLKKAIAYAQRAYAIIRSEGFLKERLYMIKLLDGFYTKIGNYKKAHELLINYITLNDSLYSEEVSSQLMIFETQNKLNNESRKLRIVHQNERTREAYFIIVLLILILLVISMIFLFQRKKSHEKEQMRQKAYLDALLEESENFISVIDNNSKNTYVSPSYIKIFGREHEIRINKSVFDYVHPDDIPMLQKLKIDLEQGKLQYEHVTFRLMNNAGEYRTVRGIIKRISDSSIINGFIINFFDVTEQQKAQEALEKSEEKYRNIFNAFPDIYFMINREGIITDISPSVTKISGYLPKEIIGKPIEDYIVETFRFKKILLNVIENRTVSDINIDILGKDGRKIHCSLNAHAFNNNEGHQAIEGTLRDISDRVEAENELKESEKKLKEANASKDKLLSLMSHDLRGAIGTQKAILSMVSEDMDNFSTEEVLSLVQTIKRSVDSTYSLVENLLAWSRLMRDNIKTEIVNNNVYAIIEEAFESVKDKAENKGVSLHYEGSKDVRGLFDTTMMAAVIRNLLTNAIKFSNPGSNVRVSVLEQEKNIEIRVRDWGIGLTRDEIKKILSGRQNIRSKPGTNNEKGTGLGMIIVREFIEMNKGKLNIESEPGKGTVFIVTLSKSK